MMLIDKRAATKNLKIAFFIGVFPKISESWFIEQTTALMDLGVDIDIYSFKKGGAGDISEKVKKYKLLEKTTYLEFPSRRSRRLMLAFSLVFKVLLLNPRILFHALNYRKYGREALSLKYLFWIAPLIGRMDKYSVVHCHFGMVANKFLIIRDILGLRQKFITTFYGQDSSKYIQAKGISAYDKLKKESSYILVMTEEMKERFVGLGFPLEKLLVHYTGVSVDNYKFHCHSFKKGDVFKIIFVGRFVEKKGLEDLLRAIKIATEDYQKIEAHIIGDTEDLVYKKKILKLIEDLGIGKNVILRGLVPHRQVLDMFSEMHLMTQLSKTAKNGDTDDLPFVLLEGQISGLPVVTTKHVGIPDGVKDGETGFLVEEGDCEAAARKILFFIRNPDISQKFSYNANRFISEKFDIKKFNNRLINLYKSLSS